MRVVRGSLPDVDRDRRVTRRASDLVASDGAPVLRVWSPPRQVTFGRRDAAVEGYGRACERAREHGYEPVERSAGGRAVAHTGSTVAFAHVVPTGERRGGIQSRYGDATERLLGALRSIGAEIRRGEPDASFCPGTHSLRNGGKVAGLAQRVSDRTAVVGGYLVVTEDDAAVVARVLAPVYEALGVPFDTATVGSVEGAGGADDVDAVIAAIEGAFVDEHDHEAVSAGELLE